MYCRCMHCIETALKDVVKGEVSGQYRSGVNCSRDKKSVVDFFEKRTWLFKGIICRVDN